MDDGLADSARRYVETRHPGAIGSLLGGSTALGLATPSSDLDIVVLYPDGGPNYVETSSHEGKLVEAFIHTSASISWWNEREAAACRPILANLCARSMVLSGEQCAIPVQRAAKKLLAGGPPPLTSTERDDRRYALSAALDDLAGTSNPAERFAVRFQVFRSACELLLRLNRRWLGNGKWLVRHLESVDDQIACDLLKWAGESGNAHELRTLAHAVLDRVGGYLQEGHVRGPKPD
ncbi:nucleotidyltransferase domain-containing protein [Spelaeicoccus albus]|uniref:Polymerase nucleotidyl transferase domain-containing protein n=1 Tax=Spelaeicoccus albus TaxID=1280376 RepID=A0A7Z0D2B5_9MICO|nr:nucleotidyltransferase domain-containing protein [Spelaeicoccus albus]NYI67574.1 hypothetical protein [Spelaeicoccus albus]